MVDAPVSGGVMGAQKASLNIMVGGSKDSFDRALPILKVMGKNIYHAGEIGSGNGAKICNNMSLGITMIAAAIIVIPKDILLQILAPLPLPISPA